MWHINCKIPHNSKHEAVFVIVVLLQTGTPWATVFEKT